MKDEAGEGDYIQDQFRVASSKESAPASQSRGWLNPHARLTGSDRMNMNMSININTYTYLRLFNALEIAA